MTGGYPDGPSVLPRDKTILTSLPALSVSVVGFSDGCGRCGSCCCCSVSGGCCCCSCLDF